MSRSCRPSQLKCILHETPLTSESLRFSVISCIYLKYRIFIFVLIIDVSVSQVGD